MVLALNINRVIFSFWIVDKKLLFFFIKLIGPLLGN